jgi:hypothetical protein
MKVLIYSLVALLASPVFAEETDVNQGLPSIDFEIYYENTLSESNIGKVSPSLDYAGFGRHLWEESGSDLKSSDKSLCAIGPYRCKSTMQALRLENVPTIYREFADADDTQIFHKSVYSGLSIELRKTYGMPSNYYENLERVREEWVGAKTTVLLEKTQSGVKVIHMQTK